MTEQKFGAVGKSLPRHDAVDQVMGKIIYTVDMQLPGMLYGKILRSPVAHAKILKLDMSAALKYPGVRAVCTAKDIPNNVFGVTHMDQPVLADDRVRFFGEAIAAVAADTEEIAQEALALIDIEFEKLPVVMDPIEAIKPESFPIHGEANLADSIQIIKGDVDEGFKQADYIIEETFKTPVVEHVHLEPHVTVANFNSDGSYKVWSASQRIHDLVQSIAKVMQLSQNKIHLISPPTGGGFGGKHEITMEPVAMVLSKKAHKPVKIEFTREEEFLASTNRHAYVMTYKTGVKKDGTLVSCHVHILSDNGAYTALGAVTLKKASYFGQSVYDIPNIRVDSTLVYTNKTMGGAMRGFGTPQVYFAVESHMDSIAAKVGMDPAELRLKNMFHDGSTNVTGQVLNNVNVEKTLRKVLERSDWFEQKGKHKKRGYGVASMQFTSGSAQYANPTAVFVKMNEDGSIIVYSGGTDFGQGATTALAQIAAECFTIPVDKVGIVLADSKNSPYDNGTVASRITTFVGKAIIKACKDLQETLMEVAERELNVSREALVIQDGKIMLNGYPNLSLTIEQAASRAYKKYGKPLLGKGIYNPLTSHIDPETGQGKPFEVYLYASQVVEVEVDTETGMVEVLKVYAAHDCGTPVNPAMVKGQIYGGIHMGVGYAMLEEMLWDDNGTLINPQLRDYVIPTALDMPEILCDLVDDPEPDGPFGAKGVGEPSLMPTAPALANAIYDAVGVRIYSLPITPEKVLMALMEKEGLI